MRIIQYALCLMLVLPLAASAQEDTTTLTHKGDAVPAFTFEIEKGKKVSIADYKGKLVWINLFATWCPPCNIELPLAQKVWEKYSTNPKFAFFVFGRQENWDKLVPYKEKKGFTFPILPDADRGIFKQFATQSIPRNILVDEKGTIIYQSIGYTPKEFEELVALIDEHLK